MYNTNRVSFSALRSSSRGRPGYRGLRQQRRDPLPQAVLDLPRPACRRLRLGCFSRRRRLPGGYTVREAGTSCELCRAVSGSTPVLVGEKEEKLHRHDSGGHRTECDAGQAGEPDRSAARPPRRPDREPTGQHRPSRGDGEHGERRPGAGPVPAAARRARRRKARRWRSPVVHTTPDDHAVAAPCPVGGFSRGRRSYGRRRGTNPSAAHRRPGRAAPSPDVAPGAHPTGTARRASGPTSRRSR